MSLKAAASARGPQMASSSTRGSAAADQAAGEAPATGNFSNIRDLVENCIHNDEITPLLRLVFEAQAIPDTLSAVSADGQQMVGIISQSLKAMAAEQEATINDVCHSNATEIATTVGEVERVQLALQGVRAALVDSNDSLQATGSQMVANIRELNELAAVQHNLGAAVAAIGAARQVLVQCLQAGQLIQQHKLYQALCLLDKIRQQHLGALLRMLSAPGGLTAQQDQQHQQHQQHRRPLSSRELAHVAQLAAFFGDLVSELVGAVQHLALLDFNDWLVSVRSQAREIGLVSIRRAAVQRSLQQDLGRERKDVLAALTAGKRVQDVAAELLKAQFRQDLLQEASVAADDRASSGQGTSTSGQSSRTEPLSSYELEALHPGDPQLAISSVLQRARASAGGASLQSLQPLLSQRTPSFSARSGASAASLGRGARLSDTQAPLQIPAQLTGKKAEGAILLDLSMTGLHRCSHIHKALGQLDAFRGRYLEQRRLQIAADLQPPPNFLEGYQAYLAQVVGFFVVESYVQRCADGLIGPTQQALLWDSALGPFKGTLERCLEGLGSAPAMLMVKDFVLLGCGALEQAGYQVKPVEEILLSSRSSYHDLLTAAIFKQLEDLFESDILADMPIRTPAQHQQQVVALGLPASVLEDEQPSSNGPGTAAANASGNDAGRTGALSPASAPASTSAAAGAAGIGGGAAGVAAGSGGPSAFPYTAPFSAAVPQALVAVHAFVKDSVAYLSGLLSGLEMLPAVFYHRDRMLSKVLVDVLSSKMHSVAASEMMRESMKVAANAWALRRCLEPLDEWTITQARPAWEQGAEGTDAHDRRAARNRKAAMAAESGATSNVAASLRAVQDGAERNVLKALTDRVFVAMAAARTAPWLPTSPVVGATNSTSTSNTPGVWVPGLLTFLQESLETARALLPPSSAAMLARRTLRVLGEAANRQLLCGPEGVKAWNLYGVERLSVELASVQRWAGKWGVPGLGEEMEEGTQLCALLLSGALDNAASPDTRRELYPALKPFVLAAVLERYKEVPSQSKKHPQWPSKRSVDALVKQLRVEAGVKGS